MATHSSFLAWRIPWAEEPGGLQSGGSRRVRRDRATKLPDHRELLVETHQLCKRKILPQRGSFQGLDSTPRGITVSRNF